jgi:undecaprenyl-diphosphatase
MTPKRICAVYIVMAFTGLCILETLLVLYIDKPLSEYSFTLPPSVISFFRTYTDLGRSDFYIWPSLAGAVVFLLLARYGKFQSNLRDRFIYIARAFILVFASVVLSGLITDIFKPMIGRARPVLLQKQNIYDFFPFSYHDWTHQSFPSGHATTGFAVSMALALLWPRWKWGFIIFAVSIAISRLIVNAHFLSDVIAGAVVGCLTVYGLHAYYRHKGWHLGPVRPE